MREVSSSSMRRITGTLNLIVAAMLAAMVACSGDRVRGPMETVHDCRPGAPVSRCREILLKAKFPAGRLESIYVALEQVVTREEAERTKGLYYRADRRRVFVHGLLFEYGKADVLEVLNAELGGPLGQAEFGKPETGMPIHPIHSWSPFATFWQTDDGYWVMDAPDAADLKSVYWISNPFQLDEKDKDIDIDDRDVDRYLPKAPKAAAIWDKLGRTLIGEGLASR